MLGLDNPIHIAFVLVLLLLVFGAKRLPELGKSMGTGLRGFKESISGEESPEHLSTAPVRVDETHELAAAPVRVDTRETLSEPNAERAPMQPAA